MRLLHLFSSLSLERWFGKRGVPEIPNPPAPPEPCRCGHCSRCRLMRKVRHLSALVGPGFDPQKQVLTLTVQIGNSDDRLTQKEWSRFVAGVNAHVVRHAKQVHFSGTAAGASPWQNAAWVVEITHAKAAALQRHLVAERRRYRQRSVAWTTGATALV